MSNQHFSNHCYSHWTLFYVIIIYSLSYDNYLKFKHNFQWDLKSFQTEILIMILINFYAGAQMSNHSDKKSPNWGFNGVLKCGDLSKSNGFSKMILYIKWD